MILHQSKETIDQIKQGKQAGGERIKRLLREIRKKVANKNDQERKPPKGPFNRTPPFGGIPALAV